MPSLVERVDRTINRHSLLPRGARVVVALSGGADSTALAYLLVDLSARGRFSVAAAAHFNHRLRGAASDEDERFCASLARSLGLGWLSGGGDVRALSRALGTSLEDAARRARYDFLAGAAASCGATHVAVGHTRDDQAETLLLQLLRGAGPRGLGAMPPERMLVHGGRVRLVRPLLDVGHADLVGWLQARGGTFREDESNRDPGFLRNRVRHELIPLLRARFSRGATEILAREAAIAAADARCLDALAADAFDRVVRDAPAGALALDLAELAGQPEAIARRVVLRALGNLAPARFVGFSEGERLLDLAAGRSAGPVSVRGGTAEVRDSRLLLSPGKRTPAAAGMNHSRSALSIPGEVILPGGRRLLSSCLRQWSGGSEAASLRARAAGSGEAIVDASRATQLSVRFRRPGDAFHPLGLAGRRKKLQDFFVDRKVPRDARDQVPLVVDGEDRIVWVAGHAVDDFFRVGAGTDAVVILTLRGESA